MILLLLEEEKKINKKLYFLLEEVEKVLSPMSIYISRAAGIDCLGFVIEVFGDHCVAKYLVYYNAEKWEVITRIYDSEYSSKVKEAEKALLNLLRK